MRLISVDEEIAIEQDCPGFTDSLVYKLRRCFGKGDYIYDLYLRKAATEALWTAIIDIPVRPNRVRPPLPGEPFRSPPPQLLRVDVVDQATSFSQFSKGVRSRDDRARLLAVNLLSHASRFADYIRSIGASLDFKPILHVVTNDKFSGKYKDFFIAYALRVWVTDPPPMSVTRTPDGRLVHMHHRRGKP